MANEFYDPWHGVKIPEDGSSTHDISYYVRQNMSLRIPSHYSLKVMTFHSFFKNAYFQSSIYILQPSAEIKQDTF